MIVQLTYGLMAVPAFSSPIGNTARLLGPRRAVEPDVDATVRRPLRGYPIAHLGFQVRDLLGGALADVVPALGQISTCLRARARRIHQTVYRPDGASQHRANHERDGVPFLRHCQTSTAPPQRILVLRLYQFLPYLARLATLKQEADRRPMPSGRQSAMGRPVR